MINIKEFLGQINFLKLFGAFFFSEFGGFLTNTVILFHLNKMTSGNFFYLGLSQALFVLPLALGTLAGGGIGEIYNKRKIMIACEMINFSLILSMVFLCDYIMAIIIIRALIVFCAGMYNPCRQSIVQEVIEKKHLKSANASFTTSTAFFHASTPLIGATLYAYFGGVKEIFILNVFTYLVGILFLFRLKYVYKTNQPVKLKMNNIMREIKSGFSHVIDRPDLTAILLNFSLAGIALGMFYPTILPFIKDVFGGGEKMYAMMMLCISIGAIIGALSAAFLMKYFAKGPILVMAAFIQTAILLCWAQTTVVEISLALLFLWGFMGMATVTTYINYIQINVEKNYRTRTFSILDQSVSMSAVLGAMLVMIIGKSLNAKQTMLIATVIAIIVLFVRCFGRGLKSLYATRT